jgi:hypothetical protein
MLKIDEIDIEREVFPDELRRRTVSDRKGSSQRVMTTDDLGQSEMKRIYQQSARYAECSGHVVGGGERFELIDEPEPLLSKR